MVDAREGLLKGTRDAYSFLLPALDAAQNWGVLDKSRHGKRFKKNFKYSMNRCLSSLDGKSLFYYILFFFQVLMFRRHYNSNMS